MHNYDLKLYSVWQKSWITNDRFKIRDSFLLTAERREESCSAIKSELQLHRIHNCAFTIQDIFL